MRRTTVVAAALVAGMLAGGGAAAAEPGDPTPTVPPGNPLDQRIDAEQEVATDEAVLGLGHVDLAPRYADGEWTLMVHDDTDVEGSVWRELDRTVVRVADAALQQVPDDPAYEFIGVEPGTGVHVVPQTQNPDVVWLGWNTQDPEVMETIDRGVTLTLAGLSGPGHLVVYLQDGGFGEPDVLWDSRAEDEQSLWVDVNTHTHANWVFSEPGVYLASITATATLVDGGEATTTGTVRLAVGEDADPAEALAAEPEQPAAATDSAEGEVEGAGSDADPGGGGTSPMVPLVGAGALLLVAGLGLGVWRGRRSRAQALAADGEDG